MTPEQFITKFYLNNNPNNLIVQLIGMAKNNNTNGIEQFARNLMKEKGRDFDKEFTTFMNQFKS